MCTLSAQLPCKSQSANTACWWQKYLEDAEADKNVWIFLLRVSQQIMEQTHQNTWKTWMTWNSLTNRESARHESNISLLNAWPLLFAPPLSSTTCQNYTAGGHSSHTRWLQLGGWKQVLLPAGVNRCVMACRWMVGGFFLTALPHFRWLHRPVFDAPFSCSAWDHVHSNATARL